MSKRFAVLIGINQYRNGVRLNAPTNDVDDWADVLGMLGFEGVRVAASPAATTTAAADEALRWLVNAVRDGGKDALGVLFFCGHGALRSGEGNALYLSDYDNQPARPPGDPNGPLAKDGSINLEDLRIQFQAHAPQGRLVAIVDTCRDEPAPLDAGALTDGHGLAYTWKQPGYPHLLLAATQRGALSYERHLDGRWRGLLTWAATTVLGQWATGGDLGATAYPALAVDELVKRATALIAAIQPTDDERQAPEVIASPEALAVPFLATAAGTLTAQPVSAPGHEWDAGSVGNIWDTSSIPWNLIGSFSVATGSNPELTLTFVQEAPTTAKNLRFAVGPKLAHTVQHTYTAAYSTWAAYSGTPPSMPYDSGAKVALAITPVPGTSDFTWKWYKLGTTSACSNLSGAVKFDKDDPKAPGSGEQWWSLTDNVHHEE